MDHRTDRRGYSEYSQWCSVREHIGYSEGSRGTDGTGGPATAALLSKDPIMPVLVAWCKWLASSATMRLSCTGKAAPATAALACRWRLPAASANLAVLCTRSFACATASVVCTRAAVALSGPATVGAATVAFRSAFTASKLSADTCSQATVQSATQSE